MAANRGAAGGSRQRFTFGQQFDPSAAAVEAYRSPQRDESERKRQAELDAARAAGFAEGHEAGLAAARAEINAAMAACLERVAMLLGDIGRSEEATGHMLARQSVDIARAVGSQLASRLMAAQPEAEVEALVAECLAQLRDEPQVAVALSPEIAEALQERLQELAAGSGFAGRLLVQGDPRLEPTDARLSWSQGSASRSRQEILQEIEAAVQRYLHGHGLAADAAAAAAE